MPLLERFLKKGTDNAKEVGVQPPVEDQRPSSDEPATRLSFVE